MTPEHLPRVWVGLFAEANVWYWCSNRWTRPRILTLGDIFVPGHHNRPTIDPATMETLATCKEIDW